MTNKLSDILTGAKEKIDLFILENSYDGIKFSSDLLFRSKSIKLNLILVKKEEEVVVFHHIIPVNILLIQEAQEAIDYIYNSTLVTIKMLAKLDATPEYEQKSTSHIGKGM